MLHAKRTSLWPRRYEIGEGGRTLTVFTAGKWRSGEFELGGTGYRVRSHRLAGTYELLTADGSVVATTDRQGPRRWSVHASGQVFRFESDSIGIRNQSLIGPDGEPAGSITRTGRAGFGASADLPGLDAEIQVFAVVVMLLRWRRRRVVAASAAASG
ncbi:MULTISPECIES: hypothetical protein [unclassified Streptomyces]|uniref:hypothetical protein n=1 Tax=unclassified Streptomyces TaxID=2593676 RepID=UPI0033B49F09